MFFAREKVKAFLSSTTFVVFLLLALIGVLSYFAITLVLGNSLYEADRQRAFAKTDEYIEKSGLSNSGKLPLHFSLTMMNELRSLAFVKFSRDDEHILLVNDKYGSLDTDKLLHLPAFYDDWAFPASSNKPFVIVKRKIGNFILQAGIAAEHYYTYQSMKVKSVFGLIVYMLVVAGISILVNRASHAPIKRTSAGIAQIAENPQAPPLSEEGNGELLDGLHQQINSLVRQNRKLVSEIQGSLDNVAHDLRTPVTRLRSVAEYGLQSDDVERLKNSLADCLEESEQIAAQLKIMMSVAEAESGTMDLDLQAVELSAGLHDAIDLYEYVAEEKGITFQLDCVEPLYVNIDSVRMRQVWANLLDNAVKYGRVGGHVQIGVERKCDQAVVSFKDDGIGISKGEQHKIWERLYRGDRSRSEKGLGLGLNYVKAVVEAHNGAVSVSSVLNEGAVFTVKLPISAPVLAGGVEIKSE